MRAAATARQQHQLVVARSNDIEFRRCAAAVAATDASRAEQPSVTISGSLLPLLASRPVAASCGRGWGGPPSSWSRHSKSVAIAGRSLAASAIWSLSISNYRSSVCARRQRATVPPTCPGSCIALSRHAPTMHSLEHSGVFHSGSLYSVCRH